MNDIREYKAKPDLLKGRVILVTGAGQGIGRMAALTFASKGAQVILLGRKLAKLEAVYDEIQVAGHTEALIFPLDLIKATEQEFTAMAEGIHQQLGRLDGILHNAAHFDVLSPLELQTAKQFEQMLRVHLLAPFALTKACLSLLRKSPDASVIFTSTTAAENPAAFWGAHSISKAAAHHMAKVWALELENVPQLRINTVVPNPVQSPQRARSHPGELPDKLPTAESLMPLYLYLMGPDSIGNTGKTFNH
ncbi:MAG TPA: YciK family oxidoreductase [Methylophilaceae bacterium]|nr:YciK family oxidoreductase [Methylophilaceae bacterium]